MKNIIQSDITKEMKGRYLYYAFDVIEDRALPDVRDGLKPVHRRILYSMHELGITPEKGYRKCARIVGDVLGKYHPHGDSSVYGALVRMAQDFSLRYPLVDGHGNYGSIDGDGAAAMRYCVTGDTLINTNEGLLKIKDIKRKSDNNDNINLYIESFNSKNNKAIKFFDSGKHDIIQIITTYGYQIKGSYNHPLLTFSCDENMFPVLKWKTLEEIKEGDFLIINKGGNQIQSKYDLIDENTAMFLGGMISEGYISNNQKYHRIGFSNKNTDFINDMKNCFSSIFPDNYIGENFNKKSQCYDIYIHDKNLYYDFMEKYDFKFGSKNKEVPSLVLKSSLKIQSIFLRYLFEGDGCPCAKSTKTNPYIAYSSSSLKLLRQIQTMLLQFGIISSISSDKKDTYRLHICGKNNLIMFKDKINFAYPIKKNLLNKYIGETEESYNTSSKDYIPFISKYIRNKYKNTWLNKNNFDRLGSFSKNKSKLKEILSDCDYVLLENLLKSEYVYLQVKKKTYLEPEKVYSIRVDSDCHSFTGNGFINHNTEAKMTKINIQMLRDINKDTVDFIPNFDGEEKEPVVLPSRFPNLLVNGSSGIAVGMATKIPPHNLNEVIDGAIHLIDNSECTIRDLIKYIPAPDFPTKATIINPQDMLQIYEEGKGSIILRSKYHIEEENKIKKIVFTEIPYQANKAKICESIADLVLKKDPVLKSIIDIRDESDREGMRIVVDIKNNTDENIIVARLFKKTKLQDSFSVILCALVNEKPEKLNLKDILFHYIEHQKEVIKRRTNFDLSKSMKRLHVLEGLKKALLNLDKTIELIKTSKSTQEAKDKIKCFLEIDDIQADKILELKLQRLTGLEIEGLENEYNELVKAIEYLNSILNNENLLLDVLKNELLEIKEKYGDERRTEIIYEDRLQEVSTTSLIEDHSTYCIITKEGYLKKLLRKSDNIKLKDGDEILCQMPSSNKSTLLIWTTKGVCYKIYQHEIPECKPSELGLYLPQHLNLDKDEKVIAMVSTRKYTGYLICAYASGKIAKIDLSSFKTKTLRSKLENALSQESPLVSLFAIEKDTQLIVKSSIDKVLIINTEDINSKASKNSSGNMVLKSKNNSTMVMCELLDNIEGIEDISYYTGKPNSVGCYLKKTDSIKLKQ